MDGLYLLDTEIQSVVSGFSFENAVLQYPIVDYRWRNHICQLPLDITVEAVVAHDNLIKVYRFPGSQSANRNYYERRYMEYAIAAIPRNHEIWRHVKEATRCRSDYQTKIVTIEFVPPKAYFWPVDIQCERDLVIQKSLRNRPCPAWVLKNGKRRAEQQLTKSPKIAKRQNKLYIFRDLLMPWLDHQTLAQLRAVCRQWKEAIESKKGITVPMIRFMEDGINFNNPWTRHTITIANPKMFFKVRRRTYFNAYQPEFFAEQRIQDTEVMMTINGLIVIYCPLHICFDSHWQCMNPQTPAEHDAYCILQNIYE